jgi:Transposase IS66 family
MSLLRSKPVADALKPWLEMSLAKVPKGSRLGEALFYGLNHWGGLIQFLDDGRIEIDSNTDRALDPSPRAHAQERTVCRPRPRRRGLGDDRVAD